MRGEYDLVLGRISPISQLPLQVIIAQSLMYVAYGWSTLFGGNTTYDLHYFSHSFSLGEKKKQNIGERSEPAGSMARKRVALSPFPDNRSAHFARQYSYFSCFSPFFWAFFHYCRALSQAKFLLMINST